MKRSFISLFFWMLAGMAAHSQGIAAYLSGPYSDYQKADTLLKLSPRYFMKARFDSLDYCVEKGLPFAIKVANPNQLSAYYLLKASINTMRGKARQALEETKQAAQFISDKTPYEITIRYYMARANCYHLLSMLDSAIYYFQVTESYNAKQNPYANWAVYLGMGQAYVHAEDFTNAEYYFQKAYGLTNAKPLSPENGYVLTLSMNMYTAWDKPEKAALLLESYNRVMTERKKIKFQDPLQNLLAGFAGANIENNLPFLNAVKESSLKTGFTVQAIISNGMIIQYYEKRKKYAEALELAYENEGLASGPGMITYLYLAKKMRYDILKKAGRYEESSLLADSLFTMKDSILTLQNREQINDLEIKYQTEKKEVEIGLLNSQKALDAKTIALLNSQKQLSDFELIRQLDIQRAMARENLLKDSVVSNEKAYSLSVTREKEKESALNAALERENQFRNNELGKEKKVRGLLIAGTALLVLTGGVILFQYRKQRQKNAVIQKQSDDMQVLMKEIHHRVKNNLQVISSLLDLQSLSIEDSRASEAVKEGRDRVQSMALIHQNLYSEGNIKGIRTREYINNLLQSLCDSYNVSNERVKVKTDIDDLNLDVDTMIPLGLVLNELVSNSLKYAFKDKNEGMLTVVLKEAGNHLYLRVSDNGKGFPGHVNARETKTFGIKMIRAFAQKLKARLSIYNDEGAVVEMEINKYKMA